MERLAISAILVLCGAGIGLAQPPRKLPDSVSSKVPEEPAKPLSPAEAARERERLLRELKEEIVSFSPEEITVTSRDGRWYVHTRKQVFKEYADRASAMEAARTIQGLRVNQFGTVPGANPPFEYWLADGKVPRGVNANLLFVPVSARTLRAEEVGGAWMITDGQRGFYNFGNNEESARKAALIFSKYGFNQLAVVGEGTPILHLPLHDPRQAMTDRNSPAPNPIPLGVLKDADRTGLLLPGNVYAGPKQPVDLKKLETKRDPRGWVLLHDGEEIGRFGSDETVARAALRTLQNARPTELVRVGDVRLPLFLSDGQPIHADPLGVPKHQLRPEQIKVQKVRETWWLFDDNRPVLELGTREDAELTLRVIRTFNLKSIAQFGRPEIGGLRLLTAGR